MANTYAWTINKLDVHPTEESLSNVVYNVHWSYTATSDQTDPEGEAYLATSIGTQSVGAPEPNSYIAFDSLTESNVVGWLEASDLDVDSLKANLDAQIVELITPTSVAKDVPW